MKVFIRTCDWSERYPWALELLGVIPGAELVLDEKRSAMDTFFRSLRASGNEGAWHIEDDVILTSDFMRKARGVVFVNGQLHIQGFSRRAQDLTIGSRLEPGRTFMHHQCVWVPPGHAEPLAAFGEHWLATWTREGQKWSKPFSDVMHLDYLIAHRLSYWLHCPSLVQHRSAASMIGNPGGRTSRSFVP